MTTAKPQIYLAARYSRFPEMQQHRAKLEALGYEVTSRWINGDHQMPEEGSPQAKHAERIRFATEDRDDLAAADIVIAFAEEPRKTTTRGGRHVELGMALALGKRVIGVSWRENVFFCLPEVEFASDGFDEVLEMLEPCEACGAVPPVGSDDNLIRLCRPCMDGCAPSETDLAEAEADRTEFA